MLGNVFSAQMIQFQSGLLYFNTLTTGNLLVIFRYFLKMLFIFSSSPFYTNFVCLPRVNDPPSLYIKDNLKFHPFFKDAIGAMDGSHFLSSGTAEERALAWDHKGLVTHNCLAGCDFNHKFTYISSGWEGSVSDSTMFFDSHITNLTIPLGKYYLADVGFSITSALLISYRGIRYHLAEWGCADLRCIPFHRFALFILIFIN
jgi:DDE superfamily endonuclease